MPYLGGSGSRPNLAGGHFAPKEADFAKGLGPPGVMNHLNGKIDAGGPYGGPTTFEGDRLTFTVTPLDPSILFFRWDFNNDSIFDYPDQTGAGPLGKWTSVKTVTRQFLDNALGDVVVEGWDGTSFRRKFNFGTNLEETQTVQQLIGFGTYTFANRFRAKANVQATELGHYHYVYALFESRIWSAATGALLGQCTAVHVNLQWNWCKLAKTVNLVQGQEYVIGTRTISYGNLINTAPDTPKVQWLGLYYCFSAALCYPSTFFSMSYTLMTDFRWKETLVLPDTTSDTASLEVRNVAPTVFALATSPSPAPEGSPVNLTASFDDPGLSDNWEARWTFPDGSTSGWRGFAKTRGGAKVLMLHSWTGDIKGIKEALSAACGSFCLSIDSLDFGPLGENRVPTLDELVPYDVLVVGTNWGRIPNSNAVGDRLAEFMDAARSTGGGIVMMAFGFYNNDVWGIGGRWRDEKSPFPLGGSQFTSATLGTVYVPDHPMLKGVSNVNALYHQSIPSVTPGAMRIADWTDGAVIAASRFDSGGPRACALNFFPALTVGGDYARLMANAVRYCSRQSDPVEKQPPFDLDWVPFTFSDDDPVTATHQDALPVRVEVRDDDQGVGSEDGTIDVVNIDPIVQGGFDTAQRDAAGNVTFKGFRIEDPALWEPTEWFAYAWDFGDGTPVQWEYKGNLTPPKFDVLLLHTLCIIGNSCTNYTALREVLLSLDDVATVDGFNFMNYPGFPQAPSLGVLLSHDVVVVAMNWGYLSFPPWDFVRRQVGDRLAQYIDADAGGVVTLMTTFDRSPLSGDSFTLSGRYVDDDYGPFEKTLYSAGGSALGAFTDPDHDLFVRVDAPEVQSAGVHSGNYSVTMGGGGHATGRNGTLLARWSDGKNAVGVKALNNGRRTVHLGLSWTIAGQDTPQLLRNAIGWAAGGIPTPFLPPITHQFGNSPSYTVDLMVIDDDMGWAWDPVNGVPVEVIPPATVSHRYITIT